MSLYCSVRATYNSL